MNDTSKEVLERYRQSAETVGFWTEEYRENIINTVERRYKGEWLMEWCIIDFLIKDDKVLVKWYKRFQPLTPEELKAQYNKEL